MMYAPDLFGENLMDDWMDEMDAWDRALTKNASKRNPLYGRHAKNIMKTDVTEKNGNYEIAVDLPGFKKDEVSLTLEDGYLTIQTNKSLEKDEKDKKGHVLRQERYAGNMARSFYVGDEVKETDVHAKFEDGVLRIAIPAADETHRVPEHKTIAIAG